MRLRRLSELLVNFMGPILHNIALCACLVGVLPVLFARCSRARLTAMLLGCISVGLGLYLFLSDTAGAVHEEWRHAGLFAVAALVLAFVSLIVTFRLDKKRETKS